MTRRIATVIAAVLLLTGCRVDGYRIDPSGVWAVWVTDNGDRWIGVGCVDPCPEPWSSWTRIGRAR